MGKRDRVSTFAIVTLISVIAMGSFHEGWEAAPVGVYTPTCGDCVPTLIQGDEGLWYVGDTVSDFPECGSTQNKAEIVMYQGSQAVRLTSEASDSGCPDNIWIDLSTYSNPGFSIPLTPETMIVFEESGELDDPQMHGWGKNCINPPCFDNVSLQLIDNKGNILAYVLQRCPWATPNVRNAIYGDTYREIFLDPDAGSYSRNLYEDFLTIPAFSATNPKIVLVVFQVNEHGWVIIDNIRIGAELIQPFANFTYSPEEPYVGTSVRFDASDSRDSNGGTNLTYHWDFDDANSESVNSPIIHHTYEEPNDCYKVRLTVEDNYGLSDPYECCLKVKRKEFMLTFDDGPIPGQTDNILLQLMKFKVDEEPVRAAFFLVGDADRLYCPWDCEWPKGSVVKDSDVVVRIDGMKHYVGNHTHHHAWFLLWWLPLPGFRFSSMEDFVMNEISDCNDAIAGALGKSPPKIFRAPYLQQRDYPSPIYGAAQQLGFTVVGGEIADKSPWEPHSLLDVKKNARDIIENWTENEPRVLIFHDNRSVTYNHIGEIIDYLLSEGYTLAHFDIERIPRQTQPIGEGIKQDLKGIARGPVDLIITDPEGLILSKDNSQISNTVYQEIEIGADGEFVDLFVIAEPKDGEYLIHVITEPNALVGDTYSLELEYRGDIYILADEVPVSEAPTEPYSFTVTQVADPSDGKD